MGMVRSFKPGDLVTVNGDSGNWLFLRGMDRTFQSGPRVYCRDVLLVVAVLPAGENTDVMVLGGGSFGWVYPGLLAKRS
jgi:hypothetical protein